MEDATGLLYIFGSIIGLIIFYYITAGAVSAGLSKTNTLLKKQNDILLKMLNEQGVDKQELDDIFLSEKKALWLSMKNSEQSVPLKKI